jgi:hypothetical protein
MHRTNATELTGLKLEGDTLDVSVVIPCLDEAATIGVVVAKARASIKRLGLRGEVVVSDNGSVDGSIEIARAAVHESCTRCAEGMEPRCGTG